MTGGVTILEGRHPTIGALYAAVDPDARYCPERVAELRFAALLSPFRDEQKARSALEAAGAVGVKPWEGKR